jgi:hypothetical protein
MASGNGSNVRTMRTRFPPGRKSGEQQQENSQGPVLGLAPAQRMPRLHNWEKESKKLRICINDSSCMAAWADGNDA